MAELEADYVQQASRLPADLVDESKQQTTGVYVEKEAQQYAKDSEIIYMETSAKTSQNVRNLFVKIAEKLPKNPVIPERESFPIVPPKGAKDKKSCC